VPECFREELRDIVRTILVYDPEQRLDVNLILVRLEYIKEVV